MEARWQQLLEVREQVLKSLETARAEGLIGNALEARVILEVSGDRLSLLQRYRNFLNDLFIVSDVGLRAAPTPDGQQGSPAVRIERAPGAKCARCWHTTTDVGLDPEFKTLCARCATAVHSILKTRGAGV